MAAIRRRWGLPTVITAVAAIAATSRLYRAPPGRYVSLRGIVRASQTSETVDAAAPAHIRHDGLAPLVAQPPAEHDGTGISVR